MLDPCWQKLWVCVGLSKWPWRKVSIPSPFVLMQLMCINGKSSFATINMVAQDCRELMPNILNVCILFVNRNQNSNAHNLASLAKVVGNRTWVGIVPDNMLFFVNVVSNSTSCNSLSCFSSCR